MLRVGLVGVGGISGAHIPAWDSAEDAELCALCDIRPEQMEKYPDKAHYTDFEEMLAREKLDIVDICLPTYLHAEYAAKAMEHGLHVLCEKPVSLRREDVEQLYGLAAVHGVTFMIAQVVRFWPEYEAVRRLYESGEYGRLLSGSMSRLGRYPAWSWDDWMMDEVRSGLVPFDLHIHDLDFLVDAFGAPQKATAFRKKLPDQDYLQAVYEFDGFFVSAEASWYASPYPFRMSFLFQFEHAVAAYENSRLMIYPRGGEGFCASEEAQADTGHISLPKSDGYTREIRYFTECVRAHRPADRIRPEQLLTVLDILKSF